MNFSKSKYVKTTKCPKMLWLESNKPELCEISADAQDRIDVGHAVGELAQKRFDGYVVVPFDKDNLGGMAQRTKELLQQGTEYIAEASFAVDNLFCSVDILHFLGGRVVELYEVKSTSSAKDSQYDDVALQCYVLTRCGYEVRRAFLMYLNNEYKRHGDLNLSELFTVEDVTERAKAAHDTVAANVKRFSIYMEQKEEPTDDLDPRCIQNDDFCEFWDYCSRHLPKPNVFDIGKKSSFKYYKQGLVSLSDLHDAGKVTDGKKLQVEHALFDLPPHIEKEAIRKFLSELTYPLYFLDFETCQMAVPQYDDAWPYEQIPFQYSLHYIEAKDGEVKHKEYLAYPADGDPRRGLAERLCADIPQNVCTLAYHKTFEQGRIKEMAALFPDLSEHLMNIHAHIIDLETPFKKRAYYVRAMEGRSSIKWVLPALFPNDPALDYHNLEGVHGGTEASRAFRAMADMTPETLEEWRRHLLEYCKLDTLAMVKVLEKLREAAE